MSCFRWMKWIWLAGILWGTSGCFVHQYDRNAPGIVEVTEKPDELEPGQRVRPEDPGEHILTLTTGPFFTIGGGGEHLENLMQLGFEATVGYRRAERSHTPGFIPGSGVWYGKNPTWGGSLGWTAFDWGEGKSDSDVGALYLEGQVRDFWLVGALGYAVEPDTGRNGPQATASFFGVNWLRLNYHWDGTYAVLYGVTLKVGNIFIWSR